MNNDTTYRWEVEIKGHLFDLDAVCDLLEPDGYVLQQHDDKQWYFSGPSVEEAGDAHDARDRAGSLIEKANAVFLLSRRDFKPVIVGCKVRTGEGDNVVGLLEAHASIQFRMRAYLTDAAGGSESQTAPFERERQWLAAAQRRPEVQAVLDVLMSGREDYDRMYRAFERIRKDLGNAATVKQLMNWSHEQYREFKGALNVPRHEDPDYKPSMERSTAVGLARELIRAWLDQKSSASPTNEHLS
jgi:hypothetical protein